MTWLRRDCWLWRRKRKLPSASKASGRWRKRERERACFLVSRFEAESSSCYLLCSINIINFYSPSISLLQHVFYSPTTATCACSLVYCKLGPGCPLIPSLVLVSALVAGWLATSLSRCRNISVPTVFQLPSLLSIPSDHVFTVTIAFLAPHEPALRITKAPRTDSAPKYSYLFWGALSLRVCTFTAFFCPSESKLAKSTPAYKGPPITFLLRVDCLLFRAGFMGC